MDFAAVAASADNAPWLLRPAALRRLTLADIRERLAGLPAPIQITQFPEVRQPRPAAILAPIGELDGEPAIVVTRRPSTMLHSRDLWVLPGGGFHPEVDRTTLDTALREAREELGLRAADIEIVGQLNTRGPIASGFVIDVFVGLVDVSRLAPDPREVAEHAVIPLSSLTAEGGYLESFDLPALNLGPIAEGVVLPMRRERPVRYFEVRPGEHLWGLQGEMLHELLSHLLPATGLEQTLKGEIGT